MGKETFQQLKRRLKRIKRPRLNSRRKQRARAVAAMKEKTDGEG